MKEGGSQANPWINLTFPQSGENHIILDETYT